MPPAELQPTRHERRVGYACAAAVVLIWAGFSLMSRWGARGGGSGLTPWDLGALRFAVAGTCAAALWLAGTGRGLGWRGLPLAVVGGLGFTLPSYAGFTFAPAAHGALMLSGSLPFLVAIGAWLAFDDRWGRTRLYSLALLLLGFALFGIEAYAWQQAPAGAWRGDLLFLAAAACWATYTLLVRRWQPTPAQCLVSVAVWSAVLYLPLWATLLPRHLAQVPMHQVVPQAVFQGIFGMLFSLPLYTVALARLGAARVTTVTALVPGTAAILAVPLLDEPLGLLSLAGVAAVGTAVAVASSRTARA